LHGREINLEEEVVFMKNTKKTIALILFIIVGQAVFAQAGQSWPYKNISERNTVVAYLRDEMEGREEEYGKLIGMIDQMIGEYRTRIATMGKIGTREQMKVFYYILNDEYKVKAFIEGVTFLSEGLLSKEPIRDCDTGCLLFYLIAQEAMWEVEAVMFGREKTTGHFCHALLKMRIDNISTAFYETTSGRWYDELEGPPVYSDMSFIAGSASQLLGNFYAYVAQNRGRMGDYTKAVAFYEKAVSLDTIMLETVFLKLGEAYSRCEEYTQAIGIYRQYINRFPETAERGREALAVPCVNLANRFAEAGDFSNAIELYTQALTALPFDSDVIMNAALTFYNYGVKLYKEKHYSEAAGALHRGLDLLERIGGAETEDYSDFIKFQNRILARMNENLNSK
jgi:hypothetical protein